jgi:putative DNA primase/helicase
MTTDYDLDELWRMDADAKQSYQWNDNGNGQRFYDIHGRDLQYIQSSSQKSDGEGWMVWTGVWTGTHWEQDRLGAVNRRAMQIAQVIRNDLLKIEEPALQKEIRTHIKYSNSVRGMENMVKVAASLGTVPILPSAFDQDPWLLNCVSGTIDLKTGEIRPHRRQDLITKVLPVHYDSEASCPRWEAFIDSITCGNRALAAYLQRAVGYSLTGVTKEHALFYLYGSGGNGKGTFLGILHALLGDYANTAAVGMLAMRTGDRNTTDIADLAGCRLVTSHEAAKDRRLDEELIKTMTGGDRIRCRHLYTNNFEFLPQFKLWFDANHHPPLNDNREGMWRRVKVIPFRARFSSAAEDIQFRADLDLKEKLLTELPGILAWAVRGCLEWQERGLDAPDQVVDATADYREQMDVLGRFLADCTVISPGDREPCKMLYKTYVEWCKRVGEAPESEKAFGTVMTERGFEAGKSQSTRYRKGIRLL